MLPVTRAFSSVAATQTGLFWQSAYRLGATGSPRIRKATGVPLHSALHLHQQPQVSLISRVPHCFTRRHLCTTAASSMAAGDSPDQQACKDASQANPQGCSSPSTVAVYVTVPSMEVGKEIAGQLVSQKLAACVNIIPSVVSVYWWEDKVNEDPELMLMIKTKETLVPSLTKTVQEMHPYDECEVIAVPIIGGAQSYLQWVADSTL